MAKVNDNFCHVKFILEMTPLRIMFSSDDPTRENILTEYAPLMGRKSKTIVSLPPPLS